MQTQIFATTETIRPKALTFQTATAYSGLSLGTLRNYERAGLIRVFNIIIPGSSRGRKLVDRESLDALLEASVGTKTTAAICAKGGKA